MKNILLLFSVLALVSYSGFGQTAGPKHTSRITLSASVTTKARITNDSISGPSRDVYLKCTPNPCHEQAVITVEIPDSVNFSEGIMRIYDSQGQVVKDLGRLQSKRMDIVWKGDGMDGKRLSDGFYFFELLINDKKYSLKISMTK